MRYARSAAAAIVGLYVLIFALFIGIFSIEKFAYILDIFLRYSIDLPTLARLYASILPDAAEFLLPIAVTIACYVVILRKREAREFLILSAAGVGHRHLLLTAFGAAAVAVALSLFVTGFVKPFGSQSFHSNYAAARADALTKGVPGGQFYSQEGSVMFVSDEPSGKEKLRVFQFSGNRLERLTASDCATLRSVGESVLAELCDARIYLLGVEQSGRTPLTAADVAQRPADGGCRFCPAADGNLDVVKVEVGSSSLAFNMSELLAPVTGERVGEKNILQLLKMRDGAFASAREARMAGGQVLLALTCLLGVAAGLAAVAATARKTGPFALAGAIGLAICAMVAARSDVLLPGPVGQPLHLAALLSMAFAVSVLAVVAAVILLHRRLITPMYLQG